MTREVLETRAFVLRAVNYGEADRIVTLFTEQRGKLSAIARGARRSQRRFAGSLEPFALLQIELVLRPTSDLQSLDRALVLEPNFGISSDLVRLGEAAMVLELCRELCPPEQPEPLLFDALSGCLLAIGAQGASTSRLVAFELYALTQSGLGPRLSECGVCGRPVPPGRSAQFDPSRGGVVCRADGGGPFTISSQTLDILGRMQNGAPAQLPAREVASVAQALRAITECHLGRRLKGAEFLRQVQGDPSFDPQSPYPRASRSTRPT